MPEFLTRKLGPLPTWGWAAVAVGGFVVYRFIKNRQSATTSATPTSAQYAATVPSNFAEPTATVSTPGGFSYSGPLSGLTSGPIGALLSSIPTGAVSSTNGSTSGPTNPPSVASTASSLPPINAANYPKQVLFGQYAPGDYTQIGTVNQGVFSGTNVGGGVPVYAGAFGGFQQGFNEATLPSGTGLYIPTSLTQYEGSHT